MCGIFCGETLFCLSLEFAIPRVSNKPRSWLGFFRKSMSSTIPAWIFSGIALLQLVKYSV